MNNVDKQYLDLAREIIENGSYKETRSGGVYSVFGRQMRFDLKEGFPILTTKKVFTKGVIHELLWFLKSDTNIKYLVDNNVHIWDDDAYRYYLELIKKHNELIDYKTNLILNKKTYCFYYDTFNVSNKIDDSKMFITLGDNLDIHIDDFGNTLDKIEPLSKEEFLDSVKKNKYITLISYFDNYSCGFYLNDYTYGNLGKIYGEQWRKQGEKQIDQIQSIIEMLKTNPDDRRMLCMAWNANELDEMALPPCHYGFQVYTRELTIIERLDWLCGHSNGEYDEWKSVSDELLDELNVPKRELSLMWMQRSVDFGLGLPFNIASYSILLSLLAQCVNMTVGEVICSLGDVHIYDAHIDGIKEQLTRDYHKFNLPKLELNKNITNIDDFKFEDIKIIGYESYPPIKLPLSVGL